MTAFVQCKCVSKAAGDAAAFQDRTYGAQMRAATPSAKGDGKERLEVRCTVCGTTHTVNPSRNK